MSEEIGRSIRRSQLTEARESRDALAFALRRADLRLLTLRLDPCTFLDDGLRPLIDLGRCSPRTAHALATVVQRGVEWGAERGAQRGVRR